MPMAVAARRGTGSTGRGPGPEGGGVLVLVLVLLYNTAVLWWTPFYRQRPGLQSSTLCFHRGSEVSIDFSRTMKSIRVSIPEYGTRGESKMLGQSPKDRL